MPQPLIADRPEWPGVRAVSELVTVETRRQLQLVDVTSVVAERVHASGVGHGLVCAQTLHTTTGLVVNENEPLLVSDLERSLERLVPRQQFFAHDDLARREAVPAGERANGHAHCKALLLAPSVTLTVVDGEVVLGRWQRLFLAELDGPRRRTLSVLVLGTEGSAWDRGRR